MRDSFIDVLFEEAKNNSDIVLVTGDLGYGVLDRFATELPAQFINSGVNEQAMMSLAAGIASTGKKVFVYSIANFPTLRCLEQIRNDVCAMNNSVTIVSVGAGYSYGSHGYTHHAVEDIAAIRSLPNIEIYSPGDPFETKWITKHLASSPTPSYLRLGKSGEIDFSANGALRSDLKLNQFRILIPGNSGTLLTTGSIGHLAIAASKILKSKGFDVSVVSAPFLSNLDSNFLLDAITKGPLLTVEEHSIRGGFGSAVLEELHRHPRINKNRVGNLAANQLDISKVGSQDFLRKANGLDVSDLINQFLALLGD